MIGKVVVAMIVIAALIYLAYDSLNKEEYKDASTDGKKVEGASPQEGVKQEENGSVRVRNDEKDGMEAQPGKEVKENKDGNGSKKEG